MVCKKVNSIVKSSHNSDGKHLQNLCHSDHSSLFLQVHAQLSFHGHRDSVKFFVAVQGSAASLPAAKAYSMAGARPPSPVCSQDTKDIDSRYKPTLVMSGGEGK